MKQNNIALGFGQGILTEGDGSVELTSFHLPVCYSHFASISQPPR